MNDVNGRTVLITGASSGIGMEMAKEMAAHEANIIIVARRHVRLEQLKMQLQEQFKVEVDVIAMDLAKDESPQELYNQVQQLGRKVDVLINNAGFGIRDKFIDIDFIKEKQMLDLMVDNLVHITKLFVQGMIQRQSGIVLNVSSVGAFQPTPYYATYAAAKSFVLNFGVALNHELKDTGVQSSVLCPGFTISEFQAVANDPLDSSVSLPKMTSEQVAKIAVKKMLKGKIVIVPGWVNRINSKLSRIIPISLATTAAAKSVGKPDKKID